MALPIALVLGQVTAFIQIEQRKETNAGGMESFVNLVEFGYACEYMYLTPYLFCARIRARRSSFVSLLQACPRPSSSWPSPYSRYLSPNLAAAAAAGLI